MRGVQHGHLILLAFQSNKTKLLNLMTYVESSRHSISTIDRYIIIHMQNIISKNGRDKLIDDYVDIYLSRNRVRIFILTNTIR